MVHSFVLELHISGLFPSFYYSKIWLRKFLSNKTMEKVQKCEVHDLFGLIFFVVQNIQVLSKHRTK
jgi:hypothetical protein